MINIGDHQVGDRVCVQYGCGMVAPIGWLNFDASPSLWLQRLPLLGRFVTVGPLVKFPKRAKYGDARRLPVADNSVDCVYCSHVLEHLSLADCRKALAETYRILRPGGLFRMVLPDLAILIQRFCESDDADRGSTFMRESLLGSEHCPRTLRDMMRRVFAHAGHLWMWEERALSQELGDAGFENIRRARFADSGMTIFQVVEDEQRWEDALGMHCNKPLNGEIENRESHPRRGSEHV